MCAGRGQDRERVGVGTHVKSWKTRLDAEFAGGFAGVVRACLGGGADVLGHLVKLSLGQPRALTSLSGEHTDEGHQLPEALNAHMG